MMTIAEFFLVHYGVDVERFLQMSYEDVYRMLHANQLLQDSRSNRLHGGTERGDM